MKKIPDTNESPVIRTDFSDELAWKSVCAAIQKPVGEFRAYVDFVNDPEFAGLEAAQLPLMPWEDRKRSFAFIVDTTTISHPDHPVMVVDLRNQPGRTFRVIPSEMWGVENNLSIANMGFEDFAEATDQDGIFRGFSDM